MHEHKNIGNRPEWRRTVIFSSMALMLASLFISRAGLSIGTILFAAAALLHRNFLRQLKSFFSHPLLTGLSLLFFIPFISGLWSDDLQEWADIIRIKLPLLILPLAFAGSWQLQEKQWKMLALFFLLLVFAGTCWSAAQYLADTGAVNAAYLKAKSIPSPLENDHIRFSWLVAAAILCGMLLLSMKQSRGMQVFLWAMIAWFAAYLHLLSARTGLLCFYIILFFYVLWQVWRKRRSAKAWAALAALFLLPFLSLLLLPTFQNRLRYIRYDLSYARSGAYLPGANDGSRLLSLKAGWEGLKKEPLGTGAGDVFNEANKWYETQVPGMLPGDRLYPSSEWLIYGRTAGWPGLILFTAVMLLPFFYGPSRHRFYWMTLNAIAAASFIFDIGLEVQFGVFIYAFTVLWWWKWLNQNPSSES